MKIVILDSTFGFQVPSINSRLSFLSLSLFSLYVVLVYVLLVLILVFVLFSLYV